MLTVQNAEIHTATVQVRTLTISGRQVTLAVFRQLRERPLISDEDGLTLNGEPWGVVEYHPDPKLCPSGAHVHVIWSKGMDLFRDAISTSIPDMATYSNPRHSAAYVKAYLRDRMSGDRSLGTEVEVPRVTISGVGVVMRHGQECVDALTAWGRLFTEVRRASEAYPDPADWDSVASEVFLPPRTGHRFERVTLSLSAALRYYHHQLDQAVADLGDEPADRAYVRLAAEVEEAIEHRRNVRRLARRLADLPQLFIAT